MQDNRLRDTEIGVPAKVCMGQGKLIPEDDQGDPSQADKFEPGELAVVRFPQNAVTS